MLTDPPPPAGVRFEHPGDEQLDRLHVGCGAVILDGWINSDLVLSPGLDLVLDGRSPLPFRNGSARFVFAEHFIEHLTREEGLAFLSECRRVLDPDVGVLRVSTPNLDWVWRTHYRYPADDETKRQGAHHLNMAFHGWGHRHLYNDVVLADGLREAGFARVEFFDYGESDCAELRGVERHEINTYRTTPECPDVIIAQGYVRR